MTFPRSKRTRQFGGLLASFLKLLSPLTLLALEFPVFIQGKPVLLQPAFNVLSLRGVCWTKESQVHRAVPGAFDSSQHALNHQILGVLKIVRSDSNLAFVPPTKELTMYLASFAAILRGM